MFMEGVALNSQLAPTVFDMRGTSLIAASIALLAATAGATVPSGCSLIAPATFSVLFGTEAGNFTVGLS